ncbi:MAG: cupin domain-containing protein [Candidatus Omnitrophica bacterium]|nr:cupin domain-containing protein [Candidatus Omnitrophota bacterium]
MLIFSNPQDPQGPAIAGLRTLAPSASIPLYRHATTDEIWFIHKGQGRLTLNSQTRTVVPGASIYLPAQAWRSLRNTGTGLLQFVWVVTHPGMEQFFRQLSQTAAGERMEGWRELGLRHGIEFATEAEIPRLLAKPRTGQGRHPGRRNRHHRRAGTVESRRQPPVATPASQPVSQTPPEALPSAPAKDAEKPAGKPPSRSSSVKEVYMGGRWIRVAGEGPVIAQGWQRPPGRSHPSRRPRRKNP